MSAGPLCWTISQRSVCRRKATGVSKSNSSPNFKSSIETRARFKKSVGFDTCRPRAQSVVGHASACQRPLAGAFFLSFSGSVWCARSLCLLPTRYNRHGMLLELVVENYAVVERLRVHFHTGLNLLTGETGSGKSIVVDALGLLLGARASAEMIRTGEARARVAGIFEVRDQAAVQKLLEPAGLEVEDGELLIEREILASGKSRAFVGSRPVAVALLKDLAPFLGDIHGQHDQQLLFSSEAQRDKLDTLAGNRDLLDSAARLYREWRSAAAELEGLERNEQEKLRLLDLWSFQRQEIESAQLAPDEDTRLENERRVLQNVQKLQESASAAYDAVYESPQSAVALAHIAAKRVEELCRIDATLDGLREHLKSAESSLQEAAYALRDYLSGLEANPARLEDCLLYTSPSPRD